MNLEVLFSSFNFLAMIGWILLIFAPRWRWTKKIVLSGAISLFLAAIYLFLMASNIGNSEGGFGSLHEVGLLFQNPLVLLGGWIHYLAFDLFIGAWEVSDSQKNGIKHVLIIPCLLFTFMLGPIGFLMYAIVKAIKTKRLSTYDSF